MNTDKIDTENKALHLTDLLAEVICPTCEGRGWVTGTGIEAVC